MFFKFFSVRVILRDGSNFDVERTLTKKPVPNVVERRNKIQRPLKIVPKEKLSKELMET